MTTNLGRPRGGTIPSGEPQLTLMRWERLRRQRKRKKLARRHHVCKWSAAPDGALHELFQYCQRRAGVGGGQEP